MKNKNLSGKLVKITYKKVNKQILVDISLLLAFIVGVIIIGRFTVLLNNDLNAVSEGKPLKAVKHTSKTVKPTKSLNIAKQDTKNKGLEDAYKVLGKTWETAIKSASKEFNVPEALIVGIANAESSLGQNYYIASDSVNCHNMWGLKGGNMKLRKDGSSLRCFNDELAGARTITKTLRLYYLDEGRDTAEKIANKYVGSNQSKYHKQWIANVKKIYN